ncbi:allantoinase AllB [soil metagenome]
MTPAVVRSERVVLPEGERPATIHLQGGRIVSIGGYAEVPAAVSLLDAGALVVLPGLVDTHVHVNEPGRTEWEGFATATRAAAAGGVTTIVDMPLNSVPATTTAGAFEKKLAAAQGQCHVDVGFWGGVVPGNASDLEPLARAGVLGFKAFLSPSGVEEFEHVAEHELREALPILARLGLPLLVHAELPAALRPIDPAGEPRAYGTWLNSRPAASEAAAIALLIRLSREYGTAIHIVHLASADALPVLRVARAGGVRITAETCPHYLTFSAEEIEDGRTDLKCAPPIRERANQELLWEALLSGDIDLIATDHSPAPPALKHVHDGDFTRAWGGIASLQLGLAAVWTGAAGRGASLSQLSGWLSAAPAALAGLSRSKGAIAIGRDADLILWDPDAEIIVDPAGLEHRHPVTPYAGMRLRGRVHRTLLRGELIYDEGRFPTPPRGRPVLQTKA